MINPKNNDDECFKWAFITAPHHEDIENNSERISKLVHSEDQYNWQEIEFPLAIQKISKFKKNNPDIAVDMPFNSKKGIYAACSSECNGKCSAEFESILKPVDEQHREKMNKMKTERKGKKPYTEKKNPLVPLGWFAYRTFAYRRLFVPDPLKNVLRKSL